MAASLGWGKPRHFSIEDAFEEAPEDAIRLYGATAESRPLSAAERYRVRSPADKLVPNVQFAPGEHRHQLDEGSTHDEDSLIGQGSSVDGLPDMTGEHWWQHPKVRENKKVVVGAFLLVIIGTLLLLTGVVIVAVPIAGFQSFVFLTAGALCFIPGAYHIVFVYMAVKGRRGYSFQQLPLFN